MNAIAHNTDSHQLAAEIRNQARLLGFDLVGIASAEPSAYREYFREWLSAGRHGEMDWLSRRFEERTDVRTYMPGARSVICVACNYQVPLSEGDGARIARYALGADYHEVLKKRLHALADCIRRAAPNAVTKVAVDTAPVMEKELSARAGVGWLGKNCCIINEQIGSWLLLGEVITTLDLPPDQPAEDRCGTCTRCIEACPTGAITAPYQLDARKCISYLTIEHRGEIDATLRSQMGDWLFGCDVCQDVCPWNSKAIESADAAFAPRFVSGRVEAQQVLQWSPQDYQQQLKGSAMKRVKLPILQRNAQIVLENAENKL